MAILSMEKRWVMGSWVLAQRSNAGLRVLCSGIVVHFTASWCIPSVAMNPFFEELASAYPDVLFLAVDVDEVKEVASKLEVKAMPTFVLMKDGAQIDRLVGANPEEIKKRIGKICGYGGRWSSTLNRNDVDDCGCSCSGKSGGDSDNGGSSGYNLAAMTKIYEGGEFECDITVPGGDLLSIDPSGGLRSSPSFTDNASLRFMELGALLDSGRPPTMEKSAMLTDALKVVNQLQNEAQKLMDSNDSAG
ncbi:hypothetical protein GH714_020183 [Hevea brasiliensis]|uniref:Thioredoxin domain-containing protein n=1 Tax=Hevea brasiliensis TaxID=3981 RepID=A0A6A6LVH7_HEVBR|nr:hypothetical protein GH714_020183 [Hevea brasiliensis]